MRHSWSARKNARWSGIVYLAVGLSDKGGIARYCRYQVRALRETLGEENVVVLSLLGTGVNDFEDSVNVNYRGNGMGVASEAVFLMTYLRECMAVRPRVIWSSHVRFLPNLLFSRFITPVAGLVANVYGEELWSGVRLPLNRRLLRRMSVILSDCYFSAELVERDYRVDPARISVIWDCVDLSRFYPSGRRTELLCAFGVPTGGKYRYLLSLGRTEKRSRYKGYDRLLDALASLREHPEIILLIAGDGDDRGRLEQRVRDERLEGRAFFLGSISERDINDVYNLCDAFALVSDRGRGRGEGIPLTPLEAAACAKPIIVGDEDGSREAVIDGVNGRCVSPRRPEDLRQAIMDLLLDDNEREKMGRAARRRIEAEFSYEGFRDKTAMVLQRLMDNHREP
jgi:phosphatidylinositol alpha-1,6-mannosyltransferase